MVRLRGYKTQRIPLFSHDNGFCHVIKKYKLIFLLIPRKGSTSIRSIKELDFSHDNIFLYLNKTEIGD